VVGVIGVPAVGPAYDRYGKDGVRIGMYVMLSDYRHWLEYDSVALVVLLVGIGLVELIVLRI
jgi:hypothetical protein